MSGRGTNNRAMRITFWATENNIDKTILTIIDLIGHILGGLVGEHQTKAIVTGCLGSRGAHVPMGNTATRGGRRDEASDKYRLAKG